MIPHETLLPDLSIGRFAVLSAIYFAAFAIKGAIGLGSLTPAVLFGTLIVGPHAAVLLALLTNICTQVQFIPQALRDGDWRVARRIIVANFAGAAVGVWLFGWLDAAILTMTLGATLGAICLADMTGVVKRFAIGRDLTKPVPMAVLSGVAGLVSGIAGAGGLFLLAIYLKHTTPDPRSFRGTILMMSTLIVGWRFVLMLWAGHVTAPLALQTATLLPFAVGGGLFGTLVFARLAPARFYLVFQLVLLFAAGVLLIKGVGALTGNVE